VNRDFPSLVTWIYEVAVLCVEIAIFGFSSLLGGYVSFYLVLTIPVAVYLLLTQGLSWLLYACLPVDFQVLVA
jgi:hypothetical protein